MIASSRGIGAHRAFPTSPSRCPPFATSTFLDQDPRQTDDDETTTDDEGGRENETKKKEAGREGAGGGCRGQGLGDEQRQLSGGSGAGGPRGGGEMSLLLVGSLVPSAGCFAGSRHPGDPDHNPRADIFHVICTDLTRTICSESTICSDV